jgi:mono/diheme cytochrome c family protein
MNLRHAAIVGLAAALVTPAFAQDNGADTYKTKCQMCHGVDGMGMTPAGKALKVPAFKSIKASDADLIAAVTNGKNKMPAYAGKLTDAQIKSVVGYIRTLQK